MSHRQTDWKNVAPLRREKNGGLRLVEGSRGRCSLTLRLMEATSREDKPAFSISRRQTSADLRTHTGHAQTLSVAPETQTLHEPEVGTGLDQSDQLQLDRVRILESQDLSDVEEDLSDPRSLSALAHSKRVSLLKQKGLPSYKSVIGENRKL